MSIIESMLSKYNIETNADANPKTLDIWSKEYFLELAKMVKT